MASVYVTNAAFLQKCIAALKGADAQIVTDAGIDASGFADGYLSKRFTLPLIVPFDTGLCLNVFDIMQYMVATQIGFRPGSGQNELLQIKNDAAKKWLLEVSKGFAELPNQIDSSPDVEEDGAQTSSNKPLSFNTFTGGGCQ